MTVSPNRLVALLTPIVFAPLAGSIAVLAARYLPGVEIDQSSLQAIFIAGATIAFGKAALWLKGWQDWEKRQAEAPGDAVDLPLTDGDKPAIAADQEGAFDDDPILEDDPMLDEDPAGDEDLDFDDGDLDEVLTAPLTAGDNGGPA
jgi:hypothetical protein